VNYNWPGNIRELENLMERLVLLITGDTITLEDIPEEMRLSIVQETCILDGSGKSFKNILKGTTEKIERNIITRALEECNGNVSKAALRLGLSRKGLQLKMVKYDLRKQDAKKG
jgi:DNA-binding NtrC family response regulator